MVLMHGGGRTVIFERCGGCRGVILVRRRYRVIVMAAIRLPAVNLDGGIAVFVRAGSRSGRTGGMVIVTLARVMVLSGLMTVVVMRLVLVGHCGSVPQPLSAGFATKSV